MPTEELAARGHANVSADHASTLEVTTDEWLTPAGDCIVGVAADRAPAEFDPDFVRTCQDSATRIVLHLESPESRDRIVGRGDPDLTFDSDRSLVCRTSTYVDDRTVMVTADGAAADVDQDLVAELTDDVPLSVTLQATPATEHGNQRTESPEGATSDQ